MYSIPSYERCVEICEQTDPTIFYEQKIELDGYPISIFNYRLARLEDFKHWNAFELRGLTFVFNKDGSLYKRYPLFEKFFNLNENESTLYDSLKDLKINYVYQKEDGSVISFIKLPNGKIVAKSKTSFISDQAILAQELFEGDIKIKNAVETLLNNGLNPIFELVSPKNKIVVNYKKSKLILLAVRNESGEYFPIDNLDLENPEKFKFTLNDLINLKSALEGIEGWVITFENGKKVKVKTDWYFNLHKILTDFTNREDYLIDLVLENKIDDLYSQLEINSETYDFVKQVEIKTLENIKKISFECQSMVNQFDGDLKKFAQEFLKEPYFEIVIKIVRGFDEMDLIKKYIKKKTYKLSSARSWLGL